MEHYKILIVDDVVENIQTITRFLESSHPEYRLYQATGGRAALQLSESTSFDLIISDWDMPGMSGIDLIRKLKADDKTSHIPVIVVSGVMLSARDLDLAMEAGAYDYLRKPVDPVELSARVNSSLTFASTHHKEIEKKNLELVEKTLILIKNSEFNIEMSKKLKQLAESCDQNNKTKELAQNLMQDLEQKMNEDSWQHFEVAFQNVHAEFSKNLVSQYPQLTPAELRHCILLKLGLNNKDIASLLYQSPDSLKVSRSRLKKKLRIGDDLNFHSFLATF